MKCLIIKKEHLDNILNNGKVWEMRSTKTNIRGRIGLIEAGSGLIMGEASLIHCRQPFAGDQEAAAWFRKHLVHRFDLLKKWRYPWVLDNVKKYDKPRPYKHPQGAVIWVNVDD